MKRTTILSGAKFISEALLKVQRGNEIAERERTAAARWAARARREERQLGNDRRIFAEGREDRPDRKRVRNNFSTEEAGRYGGGTILANVRNTGATLITERRGAKYHKKSIRTYSVNNYGSQVCRVSANRY